MQDIQAYRKESYEYLEDCDQRSKEREGLLKTWAAAAEATRVEEDT